MKEKVVMWFEGLGIGKFTVNKVAFSLFDGRIEVRWYGILITLGIILAFIYTTWRGKKSEGLVLDNVLDVGISTVVCGVLGARLYYVLTSLDQFDSFWDVFAIWNGGLGIYGGIIGGCLGILLAAKIKKLHWRRLFDAIAPGVMLAQAIGRWGNFFNGEAYGYQIGKTTKYYFFLKEFELPSEKGFFRLFRMGLYPNEYSSTHMVFVHPTFLYECLWNLTGFVLINLLYKRKKFDGQIALMYFTWYGFGRMFIEGLRTDSLYIFKGLLDGEGIRISQLIGLLCFVGGLTLIIVFLILCKKNPALCTANGARALSDPEGIEEAEEMESEESLADLETLDGVSDEALEEIDEAEDEEDSEEIEETEEIEEIEEDTEEKKNGDEN